MDDRSTVMEAEGRSAALLELDEAIDWLHQNYGSNLAAFFEQVERPKRQDPQHPPPEHSKTLTAGAGRIRKKRKTCQ